jgi:hypothetical protein
MLMIVSSQRPQLGRVCFSADRFPLWRITGC